MNFVPLHCGSSTYNIPDISNSINECPEDCTNLRRIDFPNKSIADKSDSNDTDSNNGTNISNSDNSEDDHTDDCFSFGGATGADHEFFDELFLMTDSELANNDDYTDDYKWMPSSECRFTSLSSVFFDLEDKTKRSKRKIDEQKLHDEDVLKEDQRSKKLKDQCIGSSSNENSDLNCISPSPQPTFDDGTSTSISQITIISSSSPSVLSEDDSDSSFNTTKSHTRNVFSSKVTEQTRLLLQPPSSEVYGFVNAYLVVDPVTQEVYFPRQVLSCRIGDKVETTEYGPMFLPTFNKVAVSQYTEHVVNKYQKPLHQ